MLIFDTEGDFVNEVWRQIKKGVKLVLIEGLVGQTSVMLSLHMEETKNICFEYVVTNPLANRDGSGFTRIFYEFHGEKTTEVAMKKLHAILLQEVLDGIQFLEEL